MMKRSINIICMGYILLSLLCAITLNFFPYDILPNTHPQPAYTGEVVTEEMATLMNMLVFFPSPFFGLMLSFTPNIKQNWALIIVSLFIGTSFDGVISRFDNRSGVPFSFLFDVFIIDFVANCIFLFVALTIGRSIQCILKKLKQITSTIVS